MRKLLLNPTPLFRKLRQLSMLLTLLLALPQTAWGQTTYDKGTYNSENNTWGNWQVAASNTTVSSSGQYLAFDVVDNTTATITLTLTNPGTTSEKICYAHFAYNQNENIPNENKVKLLSAKIVHTNSSETDLTNDFDEQVKSCSFFAKTPVEWSSGDNFVITLQVHNTTGATTSHSIQAAELKTGTPYGLIVNGITVTNVNQNSVTNKESYFNEQQHNVDEAVFTPEEGSNPATLTLTLADFDVSSASIAAIESSLGNLKVILAGENKIECGNNKAFNLADNSILTITTNGTNSGQLTITSTSAITTESFYSPSSATVTYANGLTASNQTSTKVLINAPTIYDITVAGTAVTSANANGITGANISGTVTYDAGNSILTLNGATLTAPIITGISGLTIDIKGTNTITTNTTCIQKMANTTPSLTFKSTSTEVGSLTLTNENGGISEISQEDISVSNELSVLLTLYGYNDYTSNLYYITDGYTTVAKIVPGYGVSVEKGTYGYTDIYEGNAANMFGDGTVSFNKADSKLTLNNASGISGIKTSLGTLNIDLIGSNSLYRSSNGSIFESSDGSAVTIKVGSNSETRGNLTLGTDPNNYSALFIDGNVTLTPIEPLEIVSGDLTTNTGTLVIAETYGITVGGVVVNAANATNVFPGGDNDGKVSFTPATSTAPNTLTLNGATISGSIYTTRENLKIILKGTNTLTAESNGICSSQNTGTLTFSKEGSDASLNITSSGSASVIRGFADLSYSGLYTATVVPHKIIDNASYKRLVKATNSDADTTAITNFYISESVTYQVWLGGVQLTAANYSGTRWSYNNNTTTLTLDNYTAESNDYAFISNMPNLNVYLKGTNTVTFTGIAGSRAFFSTYNNNGEKATLTFSTDENNKGKLDASSYNTFCEGFRDINGIYCNNGLGYYPSDCKIEAKKTPTIKFVVRDQTAGSIPASQSYVPDNGIQIPYAASYYAPKPVFSYDYQLSDTTRYEYTMSVDGVVQFALGGTTQGNPGKIDYADDGKLNILKSGELTITCTFPGNLQNEPCSASYTLKITRVFNNPFTNQPAEQIYATYYNEYEDLALPDGIVAYIATGVNNNTVTTVATGYLPHEIPVLLEKTGNVGTTITGYTGSAGNFSSNLLKYANTMVNTSGKEYVLYKNEFVKATGDISVGKCYLDMSGVSFTRGAYGIGDGSTAINATLFDNEETMNDNWYDLQGRRIQKPTKPGLYIVNGKKVIINNK